MAKNFCLLPQKAKEFRDDLKSGKLKMADLLDPKMTSEKRTEIFRKYAGSSAEDVNLAFAYEFVDPNDGPEASTKASETLFARRLGSTGGSTGGASYSPSPTPGITNYGSKKWAFQTGGVVLSSPTLSSDGSVVYVGSLDSSLYAINTNDGSTKRCVFRFMTFLALGSCRRRFFLSAKTDAFSNL